MPISVNDYLSVSVVREMFSYDEQTGLLTRKTKTGRFDRTGQVAGCVKKCGYVRVQIGKRIYQGHRIAWAVYYGEWPNEFIDHINGNRSDNRICNLRDVSHQKNTMNSKIRSNNRSGYKGVYKMRNKFMAQIHFNGSKIRLGLFETAELAHLKYVEAAKLYHGEYANF